VRPERIRPQRVVIEKIVSGGQTGADRAALDVALEIGLVVGGWVPKGRQAEDGVVAARYPNLRETESGDPAVRTQLNVRDSDATVLLSHGALEGGSALTLELANRLGRPVLHLDLRAASIQEAAQRLRDWLSIARPQTLNVAGPRSSKDPEIFEATRQVLLLALAENARRPVDEGQGR
jgi:hypothetical protein